MLRICANLKWLFTELPFLERFAAAANAGFIAVEYASPYEFAAAALRKRLVDNGLRQVLFNTPAGNPSDGGGYGYACVPGKRDAFRDGVKRALDYADALDVPPYSRHGGVQHAGVSDATAAAVFASNLWWASEEASAAGVKLV